MTTRRTKPSICFVAPNNYAVLSGRSDLPHIGGAEVQRAIIARELVNRGYRVSFVTTDHGQSDGIEHDGITVYKMCSWDDGLPVVRFVHPRWSSLHRAMARANADIYYHRTAGAETGQVAFFCRTRRRKMIYAVACDPECERELWFFTARREKWLYKYGLKSADRVIAQTPMQQQMLRDNFNRDAVIIRSCTADPGAIDRNPPATDEPKTLLWLGRFAEQKGLDFLLDLADKNPQHRFDLIGAPNTSSAYARRIVARAETMPNVHLLGHVPHAQVGDHYRSATALLCTSNYEGFPNTFLEAWANALPVVTRWDAEGTVTDKRLGVHADSVDELSSKMNAMLSDPDMWKKCSTNARSHYEQTHAVAPVVDAYESVFNDLIGLNPSTKASRELANAT